MNTWTEPSSSDGCSLVLALTLRFCFWGGPPLSALRRPFFTLAAITRVCDDALSERERSINARDLATTAIIGGLDPFWWLPYMTST